MVLGIDPNTNFVYSLKGYGISHILFIMDFTVVFITKSPDH